MSPGAQHIAIAEALPPGLIQKDDCFEGSYGILIDDVWQDFNPLTDLNAIHEAEKTLTTTQQNHFSEHLGNIVFGNGWTSGPSFKTEHSTAAQRAEAFLRTIGKWEDWK